MTNSTRGLGPLPPAQTTRASVMLIIERSTGQIVGARFQTDGDLTFLSDHISVPLFTGRSESPATAIERMWKPFLTEPVWAWLHVLCPEQGYLSISRAAASQPPSNGKPWNCL